MKVLVDADACPVRHIILETCKVYNIEVFLFTDTSHILNEEGCNIITVEKGANSADMALINKTQINDIVVTQDYGVAALALAKKANAINNDGLVYTEANIDMLLYRRYVNGKIRRAGGKCINQSKRTREDDKRFHDSFKLLIEKVKSESNIV